MNTESLQFPLRWHGRLIMLASALAVENQVQQIFAQLELTEATIAPGQRSSQARYQTWQLSAVVPDLITLRELFHLLEKLPGVKMLL